MATHWSHSVAFKRQVAQEYLGGEALRQRLAADDVALLAVQCVFHVIVGVVSTALWARAERRSG